MWAIFKRETAGFFQTPAGYIYLGIFLLLSGWFFSVSITPQNSYMVPTVDYQLVLGTLSFTLLFVIPILTMRLLSEEAKNGTDQLLYTSPVNLISIVLGKYLSALFIFFCGIAITFIYPIILSRFATLDAGLIFSGYLGVFLLGATYISIGLFASALTQNQIIAGIVTLFLILFTYLMDFLNALLNLSDKGQQILKNFLIMNRFDEFIQGLINIGTIIFYLSLIALFLFFAIRVIERRRWSKG